MKSRWNLALLPGLVLTTALLVGSQMLFLGAAFHEDLGQGRSGAAFTLENFAALASDEYYLRSLFLSVWLSLLATGLTLIVAFPVGYVLARMRGVWSNILLSAVVVSSFVTIVVKVLGLMLIFGSTGPINRMLLQAGLVTTPIPFLGTQSGVLLGLVYYTFSYAVLLSYSMVATVPRALEEAARVHGASDFGVMRQVLLPLCLPGLTAAALVLFNVDMGGFSSTALIGAGKVITLPVLIQRTVLLENDYGLGAALSALLLGVVLLINVAAGTVAARSRTTARLAT
jgi:ABC-type spermidine/putrescine transport system permease subunit I